MAANVSAKRKAAKKGKMSSSDFYIGAIVMVVLGVAGMVLAKFAAALGLGLVAGAVIFYIAFGLIRQKSSLSSAGSFFAALVLVALAVAGVAFGVGSAL